MSPTEREEAAKARIVPISINTEPSSRAAIDETDEDRHAGQAREVRNKYLQRIGVGEGGSSSDCEPLLQ